LPISRQREGVSETVVLQRLKLARVSAAVLKAYRDRKISLEQVMAFTVSDDHTAQAHVLENLRPHDRGPSSIREALTENEIAASDRRVKFVTLKTYEKAGGKTRRDLFSEGADSVFILDAALLDKLMLAKLERAAEPVAKEGWKWLEVQPDFGYGQKGRFQCIHAEPAPLPAKLAAKVEKLQQELETLREQWEEADDGSEEPARLGKIARRLAESKPGAARQYGRRNSLPWQVRLSPSAMMARLTSNGGLCVPRICRRKKAKRTGNALRLRRRPGRKRPISRPLGCVDQKPDRPHVSGAFRRIAATPRFRACRRGSCFRVPRPVERSNRGERLQITVWPQSLSRVEGSKALTQIDAAREKWSGKIPGDTGDLWTWCLKQMLVAAGEGAILADWSGPGPPIFSSGEWRGWRPEP
jgi:hypothetical protein